MKFPKPIGNSSLLDGPEISVCTKLQYDSYCSFGVIVPKVIFDLFSLSDPNFKMAAPKSIVLWLRPER